MLQARDPDMVEVHTVKCGTCAAETTLEANVDADECAYCGAAVHRRNEATRKVIRPRALLPFKVTLEEAHGKFREWIMALPHASRTLREHGEAESEMRGVYVPFWTYDADTVTFYNGRRGEFRSSSGKRETSWSEVRGCVNNSFDDILIPATDSLPRTLLEELEPWDLENLAPCQEEFLSGFRAENYSIDLATRFQTAREKMDPVIAREIRTDIGGDTQSFSNEEIRCARITYKRVLLPFWVSAFHFNNQVYRFLVNARTGEVQGERPGNGSRIALGVLAGVALLVAIVCFLLLRGR